MLYMYAANQGAAHILHIGNIFGGKITSLLASPSASAHCPPHPTPAVLAYNY
jgi:hypothetical protein